MFQNIKHPYYKKLTINYALVYVYVYLVILMYIAIARENFYGPINRHNVIVRFMLAVGLRVNIDHDHLLTGN